MQNISHDTGSSTRLDPRQTERKLLIAVFYFQGEEQWNRLTDMQVCITHELVTHTGVSSP